MSITTIIVRVPPEHSDRLASASVAGDPELARYLAAPVPAVVLELHGSGGPPEMVPAVRGSAAEAREVLAVPSRLGNALVMVENACCRFHRVAKSLARRHGGRPTVEIRDEYDVQDLLRAMLNLHFHDIRSEEWVPSYAGGASRMDFLLKEEKIVIEVKKTRDGLGPKEVGEQLLVDIGRYRSHPDCLTLVCFVYDPEGNIPYPQGIENDLNGEHDGLQVKVIVAPKGF